MGRGIEHRTIEGVIEAYKLSEHPNWGLFSGKEIMIAYDGNNMEDGEEKLENFLNALQQGASSTVYMIRIYNDDDKNITTKTPYRASTTFMLNPNAAVQQQNGITILNKDGSTKTDPTMVQRIERLERELTEEREKRHKAELANIRTEFEHRISGLSQTAAQQPDRWESIVERVIEKPDVIKNLMSGIGDIVGKFMNKPEAAAPQPQVSGTNTNTMHETAQDQHSEEVNESPEDQEIFNRLDTAIEEIEAKIGTYALVEALEKIAKMDAGKLSGMLSML